MSENPLRSETKQNASPGTHRQEKEEQCLPEFGALVLKCSALEEFPLDAPRSGQDAQFGGPARECKWPGASRRSRGYNRQFQR